MFEKKKIKKIKKRKKTFNARKYLKKKKKNTKGILRLIAFLLVSFLFVSLIIGIVLYKKYIEPLPPVEEIKNMSIAQTSIIYDKDGKELYKIFKENRTYIDYKDISKNMVNAIVAGEDQRFWTNPGFDIIGIMRAAVYGMMPGGTVKGTSGLSQQLMKVTYLTNERSIERKVKELYLSWKLNKVYDKTKILELYLNKIFFGSNAYGIEQASKTFFGVNAKDLNVLQASILASLPKAPSGLSPYSHKEKLMGYPYLILDSQKDEKIKLLAKKDVDFNKKHLDKLREFINNLKLTRIEDTAILCGVDKKFIQEGKFRIDSKGCVTLGFDDLLNFLNSINIKNEDVTIKYQTGRKDYILSRMLEDKYISFDDYKKAIIDSFGFEFNNYRISIKYPYFVMYIKEYLEKKYGKEIIEQGGFRIFTTLDSKLQDKAEELIEKYGKINESKFGAKNDALISIDNKSGGVLAMVGGRDYYDVENGGNNNMITAKLQPGSTFKPFVYALGIQNNEIGTKTPIYDVKTTFPGGYTPNNFDGRFKGKMNLSTALNASRNIPAIKMFYMAGGEEKIISFMEKLGVKTLREFKEEYNKNHPKANYSYSAPMALGTGLMTPLELAGAYSTFANLGVKNDINPIVKIIDRKGNIIEDNTIETKEKEPEISPALAYIMNSILSDSSSRPASWNSYLRNFGSKLFAMKTGTSTKQYKKNGRKIVAPRNLWTVMYTPKITTVVWAGNTDGKELYLNGNGLEGAGKINQSFMNHIYRGKNIETWKKPFKVKTIKISKISGLLPRSDFPQNLVTSAHFLNTPKKYDQSLKQVEVDSLCNGKVTSLTPKSAIKKGYLVNFHSIDSSRTSWEAGVQEWVRKGEWKKDFANVGNIITEYNEKPCERNGKANAVLKVALKNNSNLFIGTNRIGLGYKIDRPALKIDIYYENVLVTSIPLNGKTQKAMFVNVQIPASFRKTSGILSFRLIDKEYYSYNKDFKVNILDTDNIAPEIIMDNNSVIKLSVGDNVSISGKIIESGILDSVRILLNKKEVYKVKSFKFNYLLNSSILNPGENELEIIARDINANENIKNIKVILEE